MAENDENKRFVYAFDDFIVDPNDKTISIGNQSIQVPPKEFETLLFLIENRGKVVRRSEMMSAIWQDTFVEEGNLTTYVSRLRKILNRNGHKIIETVPKLGYRFNADISKNYVPETDPIVFDTQAVKTVGPGVRDESATLLRKTNVTSRRLYIGGVLFGIAALIGAAALLYFRVSTTHSDKISSMAVLPFRAINTDDNAKALGLGLTDALISKLGSAHRITVRPTSAVAHFADVTQDSTEIGRKLNVDAVLEGTIQQADGRLRISARLLRTKNGDQIWAEKFEEADEQIFEVEDRLSAKIANTLAFELSNTETKQFARRGTSNAEAYEKYLRGRFFQRQNTAEGLNRSIELYEQALALDPNFADAYAGIADADLILYNFGLRSPEQVIPKARQSVKRALELSPDLSDAYTSLAMIQFLADHDWESAQRSLQTAISLNPSNADAYHRYGYFLANVGKFDEALNQFEIARSIDPFSPIVQTGIGLTYLFSRQYQKAIDQFEKIAAENPDFSLPEWFLATSYESAGDEQKGFAASMRALELEQSNDLAERLRTIRQAQGAKAANVEWLNEALRAEKAGKESAINVAMRYASLNDRENTLQWLEKAFDEGEPTIAQIKYISKYDFVRDDLRFHDLEKRLGF